MIGWSFKLMNCNEQFYSSLKTWLASFIESSIPRKLTQFVVWLLIVQSFVRSFGILIQWSIQSWGFRWVVVPLGWGQHTYLELSLVLIKLRSCCCFMMMSYHIASMSFAWRQHLLRFILGIHLGWLGLTIGRVLSWRNHCLPSLHSRQQVVSSLCSICFGLSSLVWCWQRLTSVLLRYQNRDLNHQ